MKPRPYQRTGIDCVREVWDQGVPRALVIMATGLGKTVAFSVLVREALAEFGPEAKALILAHRTELLTQAQAKYQKIDPEELVGIFQGARKEVWARVICASVQSCYGDKLDDDGNVIRKGRRRLLPLKDIKLVIIDEAHHAMAPTYLDLLTAVEEASPDARFLGVTATPYRGDGKGLGELWNASWEGGQFRQRGKVIPVDQVNGAVAYRMGIEDGIRGGWLAPFSPRSCRFVVEADLASVRLSKSTGDFIETSLAEVMNTPEVRDEVFTKWQAHAGPGTELAPPEGRPTVIFCAGVDASLDMAKTFAEGGVLAGAVWGNGGWMDGHEVERKAVIDAYQNGDLTVLANCQVLTEGWDAPRTSCVTVARPTKSKGALVQMVGRGTRLLGLSMEESRANGKHDCLFLDFGGASVDGLVGQADLEKPDHVPDIDLDEEELEHQEMLDSDPESLEELVLFDVPDEVKRAVIRSVHAYSVDLFGGDRVAWALIDGQRVCGAARDLGVIVFKDPRGGFSALAMRAKAYRVLANNVEEHEAIRKASAFAILHGDPTFLKPGRWFTHRPASPEQIAKLERGVAANLAVDRRNSELGRPSTPLDLSGLPPHEHRHNLSMAAAMNWITYLHLRVAFNTGIAKMVPTLFPAEDRVAKVMKLKKKKGPPV